MFSDVHVFEVDPPIFTRGMNGDIAQLRDGRLLYAFGDLPDGQSGIYACSSGDRGQTWSEPQQLLAGPDARFLSPAGEAVGTPSFVRRKNGQLMMAYIWSVGHRDPYGHSYYRFSDDEGETWSDPKVLTPSSERACLVHNDKLLRLASDRILAPAELRVDMGLENDHRGFVSTAWYSDDDGHTWQRSDNHVNLLQQGIESQEPHLVELRDGRVMMLFRTYSGYVGRADSEDRGQTWSKGRIVEELELPMNSSALHVSRIPSTGDLLLVRATGNGGKEPGERPRVYNRGDGNKHYIRTPLTSVISRDEGATWENERIIAGDPYGDFGYPSVLHLDDLVLVSYHALDGLHIARIQPGWFYQQG